MSSPQLVSEFYINTIQISIAFYILLHETTANVILYIHSICLVLHRERSYTQRISIHFNFVLIVCSFIHCTATQLRYIECEYELHAYKVASMVKPIIFNGKCVFSRWLECLNQFCAATVQSIVKVKVFQSGDDFVLLCAREKRFIVKWMGLTIPCVCVWSFCFIL